MCAKRVHDINYLEYQKGYVLIDAATIRALLEAYRQRRIARDEIRVFAARSEREGLHKNSNVDLYRIVNNKSGSKGIRRLSKREIEEAAARLDSVLPELNRAFEAQQAEKGRAPETKPVARVFLRHIARGGASSVDALFLFYYALRRLRPPRGKAMMRLKDNERYARFTYDDLAQAIGVHKNTLSRTLTRLQYRGLINTLEVHKLNENAYGQLFVDGPMVSLTRPRQAIYRRPYRWTKQGREAVAAATQEKINAPPEKTSTLTNNDPKTEINRREITLKGAGRPPFSWSRSPDIQRIIERARQMREHVLEQAA